MSETLELPVLYKDEELLFPMEMIRWGYTHRFKIEVNSIVVFFEPDEEGIYRAMADEGQAGNKVDTSLLKAIGETLSQLMT